MAALNTWEPPSAGRIVDETCVIDMIMRAAMSPSGLVEFAPRSASGQAVLRAVRTQYLELCGAGLARITPQGMQLAAMRPEERQGLVHYVLLQHDHIELHTALRLRPRDTRILRRFDEVRRAIAQSDWGHHPQLGMLRQTDLAEHELTHIDPACMH